MSDLFWDYVINNVPGCALIFMRTWKGGYHGSEASFPPRAEGCSLAVIEDSIAPWSREITLEYYGQRVPNQNILKTPAPAPAPLDKTGFWNQITYNSGVTASLKSSVALDQVARKKRSNLIGRRKLK